MTPLTLRNVSIRLGTRLVLSRATAAFAPGTVTGLIGPNGAGKTTFLRAAAGLCRPCAGAIMIAGQDIARMRVKDLARLRSYIPQDGTFAWGMPVRDIVALGRIPYGRQENEADRQAIAQALTLCDLTALAARPVTALSGGERARVVLARALAQSAPILLADEPASEADLAHQMRAMALLRDVAAKGAVVLVALHDLTAAARNCDRLVLLHDGAIVADGPPAEVLTKERLLSVFGVDAWIGSAEGAPAIVPLSTRPMDARTHAAVAGGAE